MVSVVMPVYNAERYVEEAILSVQRQTFEDWELIIIDDGSSDTSREIVRRVIKGDKRIICVFNKVNRGIGFTMTHLVQLARGKYIARMDSDDIMLPTRIATQVKYMQSNPKVGALGSYLAEIDSNRRLTAVRKVPVEHERIASGLFTRQTIQNPSLMLRVSAIPTKELYFDSSLSPVDDLDFYLRLARARVQFANIPGYLMYYRTHGQNSSLVDIKRSFNLSSLVRAKALGRNKVTLNYHQRAIGALQKMMINILPNGLLYEVYTLWQGSKANGGVITPARKRRGFGVSIVMPIYMGELLVKESVLRIMRAMRSTGYTFELLVVVDGMVDRTIQKLERLSKTNPELRIVSYKNNRGKGYAVRLGMSKAKYNYVGYMDAGYDIDTNSLINMVHNINDSKQIDVFVADKTHPMSQIINVPYFRKIYSYLFRHFVGILFGKRIGDTQVGLKLFKKATVAELLKKNSFLIDRFAFDVEVMAQLMDSGANVLHVPVTIRRNGEKSSVEIGDVVRMGWDVLRLRIASIQDSKSKSLSKRGTMSGAYRSKLAVMGNG